MASSPRVNRGDIWPLETPGIGEAQGITEKRNQTYTQSVGDGIKSPKLESGKKTSNSGKAADDA